MSDIFKITSDSKNNPLAAIGKEEKKRTELSPEKKKEFSRILSNQERESGGEEDPNEKLAKEHAEIDDKPAKKGPAPLLNAENQLQTIAKDSKVAPKLGVEKPAAPPETPWSEPYVETVVETKKKPESPAMLFSKMAKEGTPPPIKNIEISLGEKDLGFTLIKPKPMEQDIALINLAVISLHPSDLVIDATTLKPVAKIPPIILELVESVHSSINPDETKTTVTLKNLGIFTGVEVTVTAFKTAKSELNIQFSNMTQEARHVLEMNLDALKQALHDKGHVVHIITATTIKDDTIAAVQPSKEREHHHHQERQHKHPNQQQHKR